MIDRLEALIDPFDLDVLNAHMRRNVVKMVQRSAVGCSIISKNFILNESLQAIFGSVLPTETMSAVGRASVSKPTAGAEQPQLLPVTPAIARFNLLPVAAPTLAGHSNVVVFNLIPLFVLI